ncbi:hypothetical protein [Chlorobium sp.]|uniref:hypothetical protein n=1 Tax=Chlorobium sp. TaxID=1095 RepID=UPI003C365AA8
MNNDHIRTLFDRGKLPALRRKPIEYRRCFGIIQFTSQCYRGNTRQTRFTHRSYLFFSFRFASGTENVQNTIRYNPHRINLHAQRHSFIFTIVIDLYHFNQKRHYSNMMKKDAASPDKYDLFIQKIDHFQSLVKEKKNLQEKIMLLQREFQEKIKLLEDELSAILKKLELNLPKLEVTDPAQTGFSRFGRGQLGKSVKDLLRSNPERAFKPKEIADALNTKSTTVSLWLNKYGMTDEEIERIPSGSGSKRFVYKIR